jgi:hypothetical protein
VKADKLRKRLLEEYPMLMAMLENDDDMPRVRRFLQALEALIASLETK